MSLLGRVRGMDPGDQQMLAGIAASLLVWWLLAGRHRYGAKGARKYV